MVMAMKLKFYNTLANPVALCAPANWTLTGKQGRLIEELGDIFIVEC